VLLLVNVIVIVRPRATTNTITITMSQSLNDKKYNQVQCEYDVFRNKHYIMIMSIIDNFVHYHRKFIHNTINLFSAQT